MEINLLPGNLERKKHSYFIRKIKVIIAILCVCLLMIVCALYFPFKAYSTDCKEKDRVESELNNFIDQSLPEQENKDKLIKYSQYANCVKSIIENRSNLMTILDDIKECIPKEVAIEDVVYSNHSIRITTNADNYAAIGKYTSGLSKIYGLTSVRVNRVALINGDGSKKYKAYICMNYTKR